MPYIAVELDAKKHVPHVARAVALPEHQVGWGLVCLWEWCWSEKTDLVHAGHLSGFFAHDGERMAAALESFGFLERIPGGYRVRGAERYLRVSAAQKLNGKKRATAPRDALGRLVGSNGSAGAPAGEPASHSPAASQPPASHPPALSPTTDDRRPTTEHRSSVSPQPKTGGGAFFAKVQEARRAHGLATERPPHPQKLATWWSEVLMELQGDEARLWAAYEHYAEDDWWAKQAPPWPFGGFISQWRDHVPRTNAA